MGDTLQLFANPREFDMLCLPDADIRLMRAFHAPSKAARYMDILLAETPWRQEQITLFGRKCEQPRLTAWYGDPDAVYTYSGITLQPLAWTETLRTIKRDIEAACGHCFNSVLLNLYRNGQDSMGWHSDDERGLGAAPVIASLSLGETRLFKLKHKIRRDLKPLTIELTEGSLLLMAGATQKCWLHGIDKVRTHKAARINLTFRHVHKI